MQIDLRAVRFRNERRMELVRKRPKRGAVKSTRLVAKQLVRCVGSYVLNMFVSEDGTTYRHVCNTYFRLFSFLCRFCYMGHSLYRSLLWKLKVTAVKQWSDWFCNLLSHIFMKRLEVAIVWLCFRAWSLLQVGLRCCDIFEVQLQVCCCGFRSDEGTIDSALHWTACEVRR
jgi:hypothetical protein